MHVGPGPDADSVDRIVFQQFLPVVVNAGNVELLSYPMARLEATIGYRHDLHPFDLAKARDVAVADVPPCTDKTDTNFFLSHAKPPPHTSAYCSSCRPSMAPGSLATPPGWDELTSVPRGERHKKGGVRQA